VITRGTSAASKITFRADDDLVEQLEELDASRAAMREALRSYLEGSDEAAGGEDRSNRTGYGRT